MSEFNEGAPRYRHLSMQELQEGLPHILASPKNDGELLGIVARPAHGERYDLYTSEISSLEGVKGDHWAKGCWKSLPDGSPDPDVQICIMNARCIDMIATARANWAPAGDNLFIDMDLTPANLPAGQRLTIGSAEIEVTAIAHNGCAKFISRYGRDACVFVNTGVGRELRLRGIYARVTKRGRVTVGDRVLKVNDA